jgi:hypothetical protein
MSEQRCYYGGLSSGPALIMAVEGAQQGGPRSKDESNMAAHAHNINLSNLLGNQGVFAAFVDDKNTVAPTANTFALLEHHIQHGPEFGCIMNKYKEVILVGLRTDV